ncbi:hypothetical protein PGUG_02114 [Meyerozyma guilliermondii ATCC 6260]|uniref:SAP domain-containing protein n=1 Tax=Meyerozyma guilliermondii (strain ATCC 6260 / CBS 566 / DSM 6381 / JCM 1539 / NBRC 10279 / NRRL Y-324) TaxID=294746 RepID=A5DFR3_PICGU|nr:uncharacterized protein PGUG_02114 [Meyerozyma guilliermondii ATCC 6260]EDK38016.1 hypothetical protein PGUG_02114 [Meyerozyma guilliermondii ATCC 6260]
MSDYSSQTVASLKEVLKSRGLAVDGKKADLVQRLTEHDAQNGGENSTAGDNEATKPEEELKEEDVADEAAAEPAKENTAIEEEEQKESKPEKKVLSPEERKKLAVELLQKKIKRAEKFGDEAAAEASRNDLARIEKFGVEAGTAVSREIGLGDRSLSDSIKFNKKHSQKKGFKNRNKKNKKGGK